MAFNLELGSLCRICLNKTNNLIDILALGESTEKWIEDIKAYYNVQIQFNEVKSSKLCPPCIEKIRTWHKEKIKAIKNQIIIDFLDVQVQEQLPHLRFNGQED